VTSPGPNFRGNSNGRLDKFSLAAETRGSLSPFQQAAEYRSLLAVIVSS
jgi:hypothetical protein